MHCIAGATLDAGASTLGIPSLEAADLEMDSAVAPLSESQVPISEEDERLAQDKAITEDAQLDSPPRMPSHEGPRASEEPESDDTLRQDSISGKESTAETGMPSEKDEDEESVEVGEPSNTATRETFSELFPGADQSAKPKGVSETTPAEEPIKQAELEIPISKKSRIYFNSIPWDHSQISNVVADPEPSKETLYFNQGPSMPTTGSAADHYVSSEIPAKKSLSAKAFDYFGTMPWSGLSADPDDDGEIMHISVGTSADDEGRDIRTAGDVPADNMLAAGMLSAARTSDRRSAGASPIPMERVSSEYFEAIPW